MKTGLRSVIEIEKKLACSESFVEVFGDSILVSENQIFRRVRSIAFRLGVRFQKVEQGDYVILPQIMVPEILSKKNVFFLNTVRPLNYVVETNPNSFTVEEFENIRTNLLFKESCRILAAEYLKMGSHDIVDRPERQILQIILMESFASSAETLGSALAHSPLEKLMWMFNSKERVLECESALIDEARSSSDLADAFRLLIVSRIYQNFNRSELTERGIDLLREIFWTSGWKRSDERSRYLKILNERSSRRHVDNLNFIMQSFGLRNVNLDFNFLKELTGHEFAIDAIEKLVGELLEGYERPIS